MTTPTIRQPPRLSSGHQREDDARRAGDAVEKALAAAEAIILKAIAAAAASVIAGRNSAGMASWSLRRLIAGTLGRAVTAAAPALSGLPGDAQQSVMQAVLTAQQSAADAADRALAAASGLDAGAAQKVLDDLAATGLTGLTDRAGRRLDVASYAGQTARTAKSRQILRAQMDSLAADGAELVIVVPETTLPPCPKCAPWAGRTLSLVPPGSLPPGGPDVAGTLAEAMAAGLLHPRCRHSIEELASGTAAPAADDGDGSDAQSAPAAAAPSPAYAAEQETGTRQRAVRRNTALVSVALTPVARRKARRRLAASRATLRAPAR